MMNDRASLDAGKACRGGDEGSRGTGFGDGVTCCRNDLQLGLGPGLLEAECARHRRHHVIAPMHDDGGNVFKL